MIEAVSVVLRPAGFWIRAVALVIDTLLFVLVQYSFSWLAGKLWGADIGEATAVTTVVTVFTLLFTCAYTVVLHAYEGQTIGKLIVAIRVVDVGGGRVGLGAAFLRYVGYYVSLGTLTLGFLMAALRRDKRALHDLLAGTRVDRLPSRHAAPEVAPPAEIPV